MERMQQLARDYVYEPNRGVEGDPAPDVLRSVAREMPFRLNGLRVFIAVDEHGEACAVGLMEDGGDKLRLAAQLYAVIETSGAPARLRAV